MTAATIASGLRSTNQFDAFSAALTAFRAARAIHESCSYAFAAAEAKASNATDGDRRLTDLEAAMTAAAHVLEAAEEALIGTPTRTLADLLVKLEIMAEAHGETSRAGQIATDARQLLEQQCCL